LRRLTGIRGQLAAAFLGVVGLGLAGYAFRVSPLLTAEPSAAGRLSAELAYDQLVGLALTLVVAIIFGRYAVKQVELARAAMAEDRQARAAAEAAQARQILMALLAELHHNWLTAPSIEGRLRLPPDIVRRAEFRFRRQRFDAAVAGQIWGLSQTSQVWAAVANA
jgi:hypothetical protein